MSFETERYVSNRVDRIKHLEDELERKKKCAEEIKQIIIASGNPAFSLIINKVNEIIGE